MATGTIIFDMAGAIPADGTGSGNSPPQAAIRVSTGVQLTNAPKMTVVDWQFDADTDEHLSWSFRMPENYSSGGTLKVLVCPFATQNSGLNFVVKSSLAAVVPTNSVYAKVLPTPDTVTIPLPSGIAAGTLVAGSLAYGSTALDSVAANSFVVLSIGRDADNAIDNAAGDMGLLAAVLEYTTT